MTNDTTNEIENLHLEDVDLRVRNTIISNADKLKVLSLKQTQMRAF
jgi:hypothetical protein